jgi:hypothetical protein
MVPGSSARSLLGSASREIANCQHDEEGVSRNAGNDP